MNFEIAFTAKAQATATEHLLQHYRREDNQEDLCFAVWRPSTGNSRFTALIDEIILPLPDDRRLHGNTSFEPQYLARAIRHAVDTKQGLAFMHSHPGHGWQDMSRADILAERDVLAYPAGATGLPLVGLTVGSDGYWSGRFWRRRRHRMKRYWCQKVRVVGDNRYTIYHNDKLIPPPRHRLALRRTIDTWGSDAQATIARLHVGIVGVGSVGAIVAEAIARIGIGHVTLIDPDKVEEHNLDRLLSATGRDVGRAKVQLASRAIRRHGTAEDFRIRPLQMSVHDDAAYRAALDCDVLFSCVDRPIPRDVLNYIAQGHLIPVIDGGIAIERDERDHSLFSAHWRTHIVTPQHACLRCNGQYNTSMVVVELDGSLDDPSYIQNLPASERGGNQNVFPFSMATAGMEVNLLLRYLLANEWWPVVRQQDYQFVTGQVRINNDKCLPHCMFRGRRAQGDLEAPHYLRRAEKKPGFRRWLRVLQGWR